MEDDTIGLYFYNARYYDPALGRFIQADSIVPDWSNPRYLNRYSYVRNNPLRYTDPTGHMDAAFDQGDAYSNAKIGPVIEFHEWQAEAYATGDYKYGQGWTARDTKVVAFGLLGTVAVAALPGAIGAVSNALLSLGSSVCLNDGDCTNETKAGLESFKHASKYGVDTYKNLRKVVAGKGLQVHHIIEKRFEDVLNLTIKTKEFLSVVLTPEEHQQFTNAWRGLIGHSRSKNPLNTLTATADDVWATAQKVYAEYPELLEAARKTVFGE